jgi:hypothetical protein
MYQLLWQDAARQTLQWNFFLPNPVQAAANECASKPFYILYAGKGDWYPTARDNHPSTVAPRVPYIPGTCALVGADYTGA